MQLEKAKAWEEVFVAFMKNWTSDPKNSMYMDVAYNSERSIEDELDRETYGDIMTIAVSYIFMFIYITFRFVNFLNRTLTWSQTNNLIPICNWTTFYFDAYEMFFKMFFPPNALFSKSTGLWKKILLFF